jgi:hypothetical protein
MNDERYNGYAIEPFESSPGRWRAKVRRLDGQKIKIKVPTKEVDSIETGGMEGFSSDDAIRMAKEMIDGGGMD